MLVLAGERPSRPTNLDILGLSEDVWVLIEKCWNQVPNVRPHATDILTLLETASCDWVSPASEAITSLSFGRPTSQNYYIAELTDTILDTVFGTTGSGSVGPREAGQSPSTSNGENRTAVI